MVPDSTKSTALVPETTNKEPLLPDRHPQGDFFICDVADAILKDLIPSMEHPFYSLSKKPDLAVRRYEHGDKWVEVTPSVKGQATIYDKDLLIYVVSQVMHKLNRGEKVDRRMRFNPRDLLIFVNRGTSGRDYYAFCDALDRLMGTVIKTNILTATDDDDVPLGDAEKTGFFHLIESAAIVRQQGRVDGRIMYVDVEISEWIFNSVRRNQVLTLSRDYFRLRKPIERRVYELARKMCGAQDRFEIGLKKLLKRSGARTQLKRFRHTIREIELNDHLPDYSVQFDSERDVVIFRNRGSVTAVYDVYEGKLEADAYDHAREAAPGWDVRYLEGEWRKWCGDEEIEPKNPSRHYIKFCRTWFEKRGRP